MSRQKKFSSKELINHLENKGVTFEKCSKGQAINFIEKNNLYYKVAAFRKNFKKKDDKYQNLDFEYLKDLASLDFQIRQLLLKISPLVKSSATSLLITRVPEVKLFGLAQTKYLRFYTCEVV